MYEFFAGVVLSLLVYVLAGAIVLVSAGFVSFLLWAIIVFAAVSFLFNRYGRTI